MSNGDQQMNCVLEICCLDGVAALAAKMAADLGVSVEEAHRYAKWMLHAFDLSTKGSLTQLKKDYARLALTHD